MNLEDIPGDDPVLLDANLLLYASAGKSPQAAALVRRCAQGGVEGVITTVGLGELCHRWMMEEALHKGFADGGSPARHLAKNKGVIPQLSNYARLTTAVVNGTLDIVPVEAGDFTAALALQSHWGLMTNDALLIAVGQRLGISQLATAASGFDHLRGWIVYKADDLAPVFTAS